MATGIEGVWEHMSETCRLQEPTSLWLLGARHFSNHNRRLRVAIDAPSFIDKYTKPIDREPFKKKNFRVGLNLFYHTLHLARTGIEALFVFDDDLAKPGPEGKNPDVKRKGVEKKDNTEGEKIDYERIIKELKDALHHLCIPYCVAQGTAIAECSAMNRAGLVDAIMSTDSTAFLFGAKTALIHESTKRKDILVKEFPSHPSLDRKTLLAIGLLVSGGFNKTAVRGCSADLAIQIGGTHYGDKLWEMAQKSYEGHNQQGEFYSWKYRLAHDLETNSCDLFDSEYPDVTNSLLELTTSPSMEIMNMYMKGIHREIPAEDNKGNSWEEVWRSEVDVTALRKFTAERFSWNNDTFLRHTTPALLLSYVRAGKDASSIISDLKPPGSEDKRPFLTVHFNLNQVAKGIAPTKNHGISDPELVPEWLVRQGCPSFYQSWLDKRKASGKNTTASATQTPCRQQRRTKKVEAGPMDSFITKTPKPGPQDRPDSLQEETPSSPVAGPSTIQPVRIETQHGPVPPSSLEPTDTPASSLDSEFCDLLASSTPSDLQVPTSSNPQTSKEIFRVGYRTLRKHYRIYKRYFECSRKPADKERERWEQIRVDIESDGMLRKRVKRSNNISGTVPQSTGAKI